jgi:hypothetical protein
MAQGTPENRVAVSVTAGIQATSATFSQTVTFEQYSEPGSLTSNYTVGRRPVIDGGVTVRVWHMLAVGVSVSSLNDSGSAQVNAKVPHPFVFQRLRDVNGTAPADHKELATNVYAAYWLRLNPRLELIVSGGPSFFRVDQDFVSDVAFSEADPFDTATYQGATVVRRRKRVAGGNVGAEAAWRLTAHLGLAAAARYSRATADFPGTSAEGVVVGGLHVGGGIRVVF